MYQDNLFYNKWNTVKQIRNFYLITQFPAEDFRGIYN